MIAHRGASADRPENTIAAFRFAAELGADAIELDVMRCGSGEVVVFHDDDLKRLAGRPDAVREAPLHALREARVGGEPIPTLDEVLEAAGPAMLVNVELKSPEVSGLAAHLGLARDDGLALEVARILSRHGCAARALVSSFDPLQLLRFRRAAPHVPVGLLFHDELARPLREGWAARLLRTQAVHPEGKQIAARAVAAWHAAGRAVNVWTVDDPREIAFLAAVGVDGVITNRPDVARVALG